MIDGIGFFEWVDMHGWSEGALLFQADSQTEIVNSEYESNSRLAYPVCLWC